ncbi:hypothetical protein H0H92_008715 [Tricholoma furcatifolium]|nr:hypothetical protein H0H92_008715 [Tricholoma furcatifolium]
MPKTKLSSVTQALYPIRTDIGLTHPLLWSDMAADLPELTEEEAQTLTWEKIRSPTGAEFDHDKLLAVLAVKNGRLPKSTLASFASLSLGDSDAKSDSDATISTTSEDVSDFEEFGSPSLSSAGSSDEEDDVQSGYNSDEDYGQELEIKYKLTLDDATPTTRIIEFLKAQETSIDGLGDDSDT